MSGVIESLEREQLRTVPAFDAGDRLRVHFQVVEGTRRRTQVFEGVVLKRQGSGVRETFTVRKQSFGVGVERTFPLHSPKIERIEVAARGDVRRAKLYYLRGRVGRRARVRERQYAADLEGTQPEAVAAPEQTAAAGPDEVPSDAEARETSDQPSEAPREGGAEGAAPGAEEAEGAEAAGEPSEGEPPDEAAPRTEESEREPEPGAPDESSEAGDEEPASGADQG